MGTKEDKVKHGLMIKGKYLILGDDPFRAKGKLRHDFGRQAILGCFSPFIQGSIWLKEEEKKSRFGTLIFVSMETITSHTCLWIVRKNLSSIMKVLLVGSSQVFELFSFMCFGFWLEITGEKGQTCKNCR